MRREGYTNRIIDFFVAKPGERVDGTALESIGGRYAWRSRVSDARRKLQAEGIGTIVNSQVKQKDGSKRSYYTFTFAKEQ